MPLVFDEWSMTWKEQDTFPTPTHINLKPGAILPNTSTTPKAIKHMDGKPRFELIPPEFMLAFADLYTHGEDKYPDRNWEKGVGDKEYYDKLFGALQRHAWKWLGGEKIDASPPHKHHMLAVAWAAAAIYTLEMREKNGK